MTYPVPAPHASGSLDVGDGNCIHWEARGNPQGKPAVVLHGGPGSGAGAWWAEFFDPQRYRVVLFDQRGCGRSTPSVADPGVSLATNTTDHLVDDIECLRRHLGIERWLVLGGSWGSTLGLAYAQLHVRKVSELVLMLVTTTSNAEVEWFTEGLRAERPEAWERFAGAVPETGRSNLLTAYNTMLNAPEASVRAHAAAAWCAWECAVAQQHPDDPPDPRFDDPAFRYQFARLVVHYFHHRAFRREHELLDGMAALADTPGVMVHGRADIGSPLWVPQALAERWPQGNLVVIDDAPHSGMHPGIAAAVVAATDRFASDDPSGPPTT